MTLREKAIEAAARIIVEEHGEAADSICSHLNERGEWTPVGPLWRVEGVPIAMAAFDAILSIIAKPDEVMIIAGVCAPVQHPERDDIFSRHQRITSAIYQAMIRKLQEV